MEAAKHATPQPPKTTGTGEAFLEIRNVVKQFDSVAAVDDISLTINRGEIFALLGASGCGKSTLLRMLAGFEKPTRGEILLDGVNIGEVPPYDRPINMMFQSYALFPHMTVFDNVAFGLKQDKMPKAEIADRVEHMLTMVHMAEYGQRKPHQLSGGQRQRVALARSLAKRPKLLLLDEPMGALDKKLREEMQLELVNIIEQVGVTCVMVTHDQEEAMTMAGRIAIMNKGRLVQVGEPHDVYEFPNCRYSAGFIGSVNLLDGEVLENESDHAVIRCADMAQPIRVDHGVDTGLGMPVTVALRPEKIRLVSADQGGQPNTASGEVEEIAYLGDVSVYHVRLQAGRRLLVTLPNVARSHHSGPTWGDTVHLQWEPESCSVLLS